MILLFLSFQMIKLRHQEGNLPEVTQPLNNWFHILGVWPQDLFSDLS